jgi:lycopene beta-cyclase
LEAGKTYDYIFIGAGCATLSIVMRMLQTAGLKEKKILIIEREPKTRNDRTWCYWEKQDGFFEEIVYKKWHRLSFLSKGFVTEFDIEPYVYKMIRGIDFYNHCFRALKSFENVELSYETILDISATGNEVNIKTLEKEYYFPGVQAVFNSVSFAQPAPSVQLFQHFKGWLIETEETSFDSTVATLMDYRYQPDSKNAFFYVLPVSSRLALVEYTFFSRHILPHTTYETGLKNYITDYLAVNRYKILEEEFGVIPMSNEKYETRNGIQYNIGTAGGQTKASSGYTFQFIQKQAKELVTGLVQNELKKQSGWLASRFSFYDNTLLQVLNEDYASAGQLFTTLFKKNKPALLLKFLDNESSVWEEIKIISSLPSTPFLKAVFTSKK